MEFNGFHLKRETMAKRRKWIEGRAKVEREGGCRVCGFVGAEAHHLIPRSLAGDDHADNFVPLCSKHHRAVHDHTFNIWPLLTTAEKEHAAELKGSGGSRMYLDLNERSKDERAGVRSSTSSE